MDKASFIYMAIETFVLLVPIGALFIKLGEKSKVISQLEERTKGITEWKAATETKVTQLELQTIAQQNTVDSINKSLIEISTKVGLLLENKIKMGEA